MNDDSPLSGFTNLNVALRGALNLTLWAFRPVVLHSQTKFPFLSRTHGVGKLRR